MPVNPNMARVYFRGQKGGCATYVARETAEEYVSRRLAVWNSTQSAIMLVRSEEEVRRNDAEKQRHKAPPLAESLVVGQRVMNKAAIEDSRYHQTLAAAYRRSPDDHKHNKTRA